MRLVILFSGLLLAACDPFCSDTAKNDKAEITNFLLNGKQGTINQSTGKISFTFKKGTDASNLTAKVLGLSAGATISPDPARTKDYTSDVVFTITAEDKKHRKTFTVSVTDSKKINDKAEIMSFSFRVANEDVKIDSTEKTITVQLPYGAPIDKLTASYVLSAGASITPDPKTARDYTSDVKFTITAEDKKHRKTFTVSVTVLDKINDKADSKKINDKAEIMSFSFRVANEDVKIDSTEKTITVQLPYGAPIDKLTASYVLSAGASITPDPKTARDYTSDVEFTITAEDKKHRKIFTVSVTVLDKINDKADSKKINDKAEITSFSFRVANEDVQIDSTERTITVKLPYGAPIDKLTASYTLSAGASITPDPETPFDYDVGSKTFTVTAEDSTTKKIYTITVEVLPNTEAKIIAFSLDNDANDTVNIDHSKGEITVGLKYIPQKTDITRLTATLTLSDKASIMSAFDPSKKGADYHKTYQTPQKVSISAEDGQTTQTYEIKVQIKVSNANRFDVVYGEIKRMGGKTNTVFTGDLNHLDMSAVSNMEYLFSGDKTKNTTYREYAKQFNGTISKWEVGNVRDMSGMFNRASSFNKDISEWKVGNVTDMSSMFNMASKFNRPLEDWKVENVENMSHMFNLAVDFNKPLDNWEVSKVTNMRAMFKGALKFNRNISKWKVGNVTNMRAMFYLATRFNQDLRKWIVSQVTDCTDFSRKAVIRFKPLFTTCKE